MSSFTEYLQASYQELQTKVTWPTWRELQESSVLVFVASLLIAFIVSAMDWVFGVNAAGLHVVRRCRVVVPIALNPAILQS